MKALKAAAKSLAISRGKVIAQTCPHCGKFRIVSIAEHERHDKQCHRRSRE